MRQVAKYDDEGYLRIYLVRDSDEDAEAEKGIPLVIPDLSNIDWKEVERDLHNALTKNGLFTWDDVQKKQKSVRIDSLVRSILTRRIVNLYRE